MSTEFIDECPLTQVRIFRRLLSKIKLSETTASELRTVVHIGFCLLARIADTLLKTSCEDPYAMALLHDAAVRLSLTAAKTRMSDPKIDNLLWKTMLSSARTSYKLKIQFLAGLHFVAQQKCHMYATPTAGI